MILIDEQLSWLTVRRELQIVYIWSGRCHCYLKTPSSFVSLKSGMVLPFSYELVINLPGIVWERKNFWENANNHQLQPVVSIQRRASSWRWVLGQQQNSQVPVREWVFCRWSIQGERSSVATFIEGRPVWWYVHVHSFCIVFSQLICYNALLSNEWN